MLTACFDTLGTVSVEHVKSVVADKLRLFQRALEMGTVLNSETKKIVDISEYVYQVLLQNGAFYHRAYHVQPCERTLISLGKCSIIRGVLPGENCQYSGLAPILKTPDNGFRFTEQYDLPTCFGKDLVNFVWTRSVPVTSGAVISEYLKYDNLRQGYYTSKRKDAYPTTMGRTSHPNVGYEHYIIRRNEARRIPDRLVDEGWHEYCRLAIVNEMTQQSVSVTNDGGILQLKFGYKLPPNDLRFLRYIAWPITLRSMDGAFEFYVHHNVWPALKQRLTELNYKVEEA